MPRFASSSARRGPTPLRYITSVVGVRGIHSPGRLHAASPWCWLPARRAALAGEWRVETVLILYITAGLHVLLLAIVSRMRKDGALLPWPWEARLSQERLDRNDKKVLLIWILAGLLGAGVAHRYFFQAFPEASVEFKRSEEHTSELQSLAY